MTTVDAYAGFITAVAAGIALWRTIRALRNAARKVQDIRDLRHTPAAPDNQAGTNTDDLWTCRRIDAEPLADPDHTRRLINYLRDTAGEGEQ